MLPIKAGESSDWFGRLAQQRGETGEGGGRLQVTGAFLEAPEVTFMGFLLFFLNLKI